MVTDGSDTESANRSLALLNSSPVTGRRDRRKATVPALMPTHCRPLPSVSSNAQSTCTKHESAMGEPSGLNCSTATLLLTNVQLAFSISIHSGT